MDLFLNNALHRIVHSIAKKIPATTFDTRQPMANHFFRFTVYGAEVWQIPTREINKILSTEMDVLRRSARKSRMEKLKMNI